MKKIRYALAGTGSRGVSMFAEPFVKGYADVAELVCLCDRPATIEGLLLEPLKEGLNGDA